MFLLAMVLLGLAMPKIFANILGKDISRLKLFLILLTLFIATTAVAIISEPSDLPASNGHEDKTARPGYFRVARVVDGDTIKVEIEGKIETVRLIGIDAPETPKECFSQEAKVRMSELSEGKQVKLKADASQNNRGEYGRLLRYVLAEDGTNLNKLMIAEGYAREFTYKTPYQLQDKFKKSQAEAKNDKLGLWSAKCNNATRQ